MNMENYQLVSISGKGSWGLDSAILLPISTLIICVQL